METLGLEFTLGVRLPEADRTLYTRERAQPPKTALPDRTLKLSSIPLLEGHTSPSPGVPLTYPPQYIVVGVAW